MSEFCVIGSGISGATIANLLNKKNSVIYLTKREVQEDVHLSKE